MQSACIIPWHYAGGAGNWTAVERPLWGISVDVPKGELLPQAVQVVLEVLLLHMDELKLMHGEAHGRVALMAVLFLLQVVGHVLNPGAPSGQEAQAHAVHGQQPLCGRQPARCAAGSQPRCPRG